MKTLLNKIRKEYRYYSFIIRWFIIGKFHCKAIQYKPKIKLFFKTLYISFWYGILLILCCYISELIF
jgi:hypothetical protein